MNAGQGGGNLRAQECWFSDTCSEQRAAHRTGFPRTRSSGPTCAGAGLGFAARPGSTRESSPRSWVAGGCFRTFRCASGGVPGGAAPDDRSRNRGIKPQRASALGHTDPSVVLSPRNPVLDSVDACSFCPVAPVMPPVRRGLPSSEEDRLSARIPDACPEPTRATAVLLVPDPEFDGAMQTDPFAGGAYKNVSLRGQGQAQQNCNQRACNKALNGGV